MANHYHLTEDVFALHYSQLNFLKISTGKDTGPLYNLWQWADGSFTLTFTGFERSLRHVTMIYLQYDTG